MNYRVVSLCMSPVNDSFMSGSLDHSVRMWDLRVNACQGPFDTFLVGGDTAEVCDIKFSNDGKSMLLTTTNNNVYLLDAYHGEKKCGFNMDTSANATIEATFTPDGQYVVSGSGDGHIHAWNISDEPNKVASLDSHIGVPACLRWAPRRVMFAAAASSVLTFWIPDDAKPDAEPDAPAPAP